MSPERSNGPARHDPPDGGRSRGGSPDPVPASPTPPAACDVCGSTDLREIRCKVICGNCRTILKSCADL